MDFRALLTQASEESKIGLSNDLASANGLNSGSEIDPFKKSLLSIFNFKKYL